MSLIQKILRHEAPSTTERYLKSLGFDTEELKGAVEEFSKRGPAEVIPLKEKAPGVAAPRAQKISSTGNENTNINETRENRWRERRDSNSRPPA